jgi:ethanolamine ammonia-lyase large subunit
MPRSANGRSFGTLAEVMAKANEPKSGDELAGLAARDGTERVAAKSVLADTSLSRFVEEPLLPPEDDELTRTFLDELDRDAYARLAGWSTGEFRERLLADPPEELAGLRRGLVPEMAAAVAKLMSNLDLMLAAHRLPVVVKGRTTLGEPGRLATRIQPTTRAMGSTASWLRRSRDSPTAAAMRCSA